MSKLGRTGTEEPAHTEIDAGGKGCLNVRPILSLTATFLATLMIVLNRPWKPERKNTDNLVNDAVDLKTRLMNERTTKEDLAEQLQIAAHRGQLMLL